MFGSRIDNSYLSTRHHEWRRPGAPGGPGGPPVFNPNLERDVVPDGFSVPTHTRQQNTEIMLPGGVSIPKHKLKGPGLQAKPFLNRNIVVM